MYECLRVISGGERKRFLRTRNSGKPAARVEKPEAHKNFGSLVFSMSEREGKWSGFSE